MAKLAGSNPRYPKGVRSVGRVAPDAHVEVTLYLRPKCSRKEWKDRLEDNQHPLTREELRGKYGASNRDIKAVQKFAKKYNLQAKVDPGQRRVVLAGSNAHFEAAFGIKRRVYEGPAGRFPGHEAALNVPTSLHGIIAGVFGLDESPAQRIGKSYAELNTEPNAPGSPKATYPVTEIAKLYGFPVKFDGRGQRIGLIEPGGGFRYQDLRAYFEKLQLPMPKITSVPVDGAGNAPGDQLDREVTGDIQVAGAAAPGAKLIIYFAPSTKRGLLDAVVCAVHDRKNRPTVLSISWGDFERNWTKLELERLNDILETAKALQMTVCCASGDTGSSNWKVYFPASSPFALACGGIQFVSSGGRIVSERVWNDAHGTSSGGASKFFRAPHWQKREDLSPPSGRAIPDVAGPAEDYFIFVNGQPTVGGGTSAVAPLWAGLVARINQQLKRPVGHLNPFLYREHGRLWESGALRDITMGETGVHDGTKIIPGWDAGTGLGAPNGEKLAAALAKSSTVGSTHHQASMHR